MQCPIHSLGEQIRDARVAHGLTQEELAQRAKVAQSQLQKFERGRNVTLKTLMKLLAELPNLTSLRIQHVDVQLAVARPTALARLRSWLWRKA